MDDTQTIKTARSGGGDNAAATTELPDLIISADSHVTEPLDLWTSLPDDICARMPEMTPFGSLPDGGEDPVARIRDMDTDGLAAEVLYPTAGLGLYRCEPDIQEAAFRGYNDWIAEYCAHSPDRLIGIPMIQAHDIDAAIAELHRCYDMGLKGALVWQVPHPELPLYSSHYDPLWAAAAELGAPVSMHILTGHSYDRTGRRTGFDHVRGSVNIKTFDAINCIYDMVWSGVFERHPKLHMIMVEAEIGWIPFTIQQWDYYFHRHRGKAENYFPIERAPSEICAEHVFATFMDDTVGSYVLPHWGDRNCMWSSDYPHENTTWPNSRDFIAKQVGDLPMAKKQRLLSETVNRLYDLGF
jgi:predicted TIM-barrel fold metal-dependent hydrolase